LKNILIIKHGSLGDIISATSVLRDIRDHYKNDNIIILTVNKFEIFFRESPFIDDVLIDNREGVFNSVKLIKSILKLKFDLMIDLQNSNRTSIYQFLFRLLSSIDINGTGLFATIRYKNPNKNLPSVIDGLSNQIEKLGIKTRRKPFVKWLSKNFFDASLIKTKKYFIINPGCSINSPQKKWHKEKYTKICTFLISKKILPILIGAYADKESTDYIYKHENRCLNLYNKSSLNIIFQLAENAVGALSNDTGPAHLIASSGCKLHLVLSSFSNINTVIPTAHNVTFTQKKNVDDISSKEIINLLQATYNL